MSLVTDPLYTVSALNYTLYEYELPKRILPGESLKINLRELYLKRFEPLPKTIDLRED